MNVPGATPPGLEKRAMTRFHRVIKAQRKFWCPICALWMDEKKCLTAVGHPSVKDGKVSITVFGLCDPCINRRCRGIDPVQAVKEALAERSARRSTSAEPEDGRVYEGRVRYIMITED